MKKIFFCFLAFIFFINFVFAYPLEIKPTTDWKTSYFSGQTTDNKLKICSNLKEPLFVYLTYNISENKKNLEGINFSLSESSFWLKGCKEVNFTMSSVINYAPDTFKVTFIVQGEGYSNEKTIINNFFNNIDNSTSWFSNFTFFESLFSISILGIGITILSILI